MEVLEHTDIIADTAAEDLHAGLARALTDLSTCVRCVRQYGRSHPVIEEKATVAHQALAEMLILQPTVVLAVADSYLAIESFPVEDRYGSLLPFADLLRERNVGEIKLSAGITKSEVIEFAEVFGLSPEELTLRGGPDKELRKRNVAHIQTRAGSVPTRIREGKGPAEVYEESLVLLEGAMKAVKGGLDVPVPEIRSVVAESLHQLVEDDSALLALAGIRSYDRYLSEHSVNVCILSMVLGRDLGLDVASTLELGVSAMLHDVGKVFVPAGIVKKSGRLNEEEWQRIRMHPAEGARVLAGLTELPALASTIALEHHVRGDGTGYPSLPMDQRPHLLSRLVAIVDTYDALTTERPYRERWGPLKAIGWMLYEASTGYDGQLMARFASRAGLYPSGSIVRLKRGDYAVVVAGSHRHPSTPTLRIIDAAEGSPSGATVVDLSTNTDPAFEIEAMAQPVEALLPYGLRYLASWSGISDPGLNGSARAASDPLSLDGKRSG